MERLAQGVDPLDSTAWRMRNEDGEMDKMGTYVEALLHEVGDGVADDRGLVVAHVGVLVEGHAQRDELVRHLLDHGVVRPGAAKGKEIDNGGGQGAVGQWVAAEGRHIWGSMGRERSMYVWGPRICQARLHPA